MNISSLYIHIPFCARKCAYCDFFSVPYDESSACAYTDALCRELYLKSRVAGCLKTVYIGGGTPSLLTDACFIRIFSCLRDSYHISCDTEISVEANPGTLSRSKVDLLVSLGVTRISLGIQSFNDDELQILGRIHTSLDALHSLKYIQESGLRNYSIDLMYGIPGQSFDSWTSTLAKAVEYIPKHISSYELTFEAGAPICNLIKPGEEHILGMYGHAIDYLAMHGYEHYEISNFAQTGFQCRHNLNYWNRGGYLGAGAGAHSFIGGTRSNNISDVGRYIERLSGNLLPESESIRIPHEDHLREYLFLGLRKTAGISIAEAKYLGINISGAAGELIETGFLEIANDSLRFTRCGMVISNAVIVTLFGNLGL
jgi:oxygen-independent coproporphyrinogen III oxidase